MHLCDYLRRRSFDRPGTWIVAVTLLCLLTVFVITAKNRYAESLREDRFHNYLNEVRLLVIIFCFNVYFNN